MKVIDFKEPFYRPVKIRIAIVAVCVGWGLLELLQGHHIWAAGFILVGLYAAWRFSTNDYGSVPDDQTSGQ